MLITIIYIGAGGFIGAVMRFLLSRYLNNFMVNFPLGTLCVNALGSFVLGFIIYSLSAGKKIPGDVRDFLTIGLIGGFTTMSSFAYESIRLMEINQYLLSVINITLNVVLSLIAVYLGKELSILIYKQ